MTPLAATLVARVQLGGVCSAAVMASLMTWMVGRGRAAALSGTMNTLLQAAGGGAHSTCAIERNRGDIEGMTLSVIAVATAGTTCSAGTA